MTRGVNIEKDLISRLKAVAAKEDKTIKDLKAAGIWYKDDVRYQFNLHTQQASNLNWKTSGHTITAVNSPIWNIFDGYRGVTSAYLRTNYIPSSQGVNYLLNDAGIGIGTNYYIDEFKYLISTRSTDGDLSAIWTGGDAGVYGTVNGNTSNIPLVTGGTTQGIFDVSRYTSTGVTTYAGGIYMGTTAVPQGIVPTREFWILALNDQGGSALATSNTVNYARMGGSLSAAQVKRNKEIVEYFNNNVAATFDYDPEMIVNGGFTTDSNWVTESYWSIHDGRAYFNGTGAWNHIIQFDLDFKIGDFLKIEIDVYDLVGKLLIYNNAGFENMGAITTSGHFTWLTTSILDSSQIQFTTWDAGVNSGSIDNMSVKKIHNPVMLGPELFTGWTNVYFDTFTSNGNIVTSAINTGSDYGGCIGTERFPVAVGEVYYITTYYVINSGANPLWYIGSGAVGSSFSTPNFNLTSGSLRTYVVTIITANSNATLACEVYGASNWSLNYISVKKLLK